MRDHDVLDSDVRDARFRALASPSRRALLRLVRDEPRPVGELAAELGISQPATSQHLGILRDAGLVVAAANGRQRLYRSDPDAITDVRAWFDEYWSSSLERLDRAARRAAIVRRSAS